MRSLAGLLAASVLVLMPTVSAGQAHGASLEFQYTEIVLVDNQYVVNGTMAMTANTRLEELVNAGIVVPFVAEFVVTHPRWYWLDETVIDRTLEFKLSYHALTRQYLLTAGSVHSSFDTYEGALAAMLVLRNWVVADRNRLRPGESYNAALRFHMDLTQLPKPFQVAALGNRDLDISTGWTNWTFLSASR